MARSKGNHPLRINRGVPYKPHKPRPSEANPDRKPSRASTPLTDEQKKKVAEQKALAICGIRARRFARKYPFVSEDDFFQEAFLGYADAVRSYDANGGSTFSSYADLRIDGSCLDWLQRTAIIRVPKDVRRAARERGERVATVWTIDATFNMDSEFTAFTETSSDLMQPADDAPEPWEVLGSEENFLAWIRGMDPVKRFIVRKYYGPEAWTMQQIADHLGIGQTVVSRRHAEIIANLRDRARQFRYRDLASA